MCLQKVEKITSKGALYMTFIMSEMKYKTDDNIFTFKDIHHKTEES